MHTKKSNFYNFNYIPSRALKETMKELGRKGKVNVKAGKEFCSTFSMKATCLNFHSIEGGIYSLPYRLQTIPIFF